MNEQVERSEKVGRVKNRKRVLGLTLGLLLVGAVAMPAPAAEFDIWDLRGRYTGHLNIGASFSDGTTTQRLEVQLLTALSFDGKSTITGASRLTVSIPQQPPTTCRFAITGTYALDETGLGTATLVLVPSDPACSDGGGATLQASLVLGGLHRRRLDITINGATDGSGEALPVVGAGTLEK